DHVAQVVRIARGVPPWDRDGIRCPGAPDWRGAPADRALTWRVVRALLLHGPSDLRLAEVPEPVPGPGEVVLRVEVALTCATDAKMLRQGRHPALPALPAPLGHEATGIVSTVGPGVEGPRVGDAVV